MKKILISLLTVLMMVGTPIVLNVDSFIRIQNVYATVKINKKTVRVLKGKTITLKITGTKKKVIWSSNKKSIATVNSKGVVTGKKKGTAAITAKVGNKKYTCKVAVETPSLNKTNISITKGKTYQLKLNGTSQKVTWSTSNKSIAIVTSNGKVTAKKVGATYIKAKVQGKIYSCKVVVKKIKKITKNTAIEMVRKKTNNKFYYFCDERIVSYKGKQYYIVYVKQHVGNHYSTITQYLVSLDGSVCKEGWYVNENNMGFY